MVNSYWWGHIHHDTHLFQFFFFYNGMDTRFLNTYVFSQTTVDDFVMSTKCLCVCGSVNLYVVVVLILLVCDKLLSSNVSWRSNSIGILLHGVDRCVSRIWAWDNIGVGSCQFWVVELVLELNVVRVNSKSIMKLE